MDRLDELTLLVAVIDEGTMAGAGRRLRRSPPAVSRMLNALEDRVGVRLIERTTRRLSATEAGSYLADRARTMLADYDAATNAAAGAPLRGLLRVTAPVQFGRLHVAPVVASFLDDHPSMSIELVLHDRHLDLIDEGLDVAVRIGALAESSLLARRVGGVTAVLVASPGYLARRGQPQTLVDLAAHDTIFGSSRAGAPEWRFGRGVAIRLEPRLLVNEVEAQPIAIRAGRGIARLLSYQVIDDLAAGTLVRVLTNTEPPPLPVQLVARGGPHMAPKIRLFLDHAAGRLRDLEVINGAWPAPRKQPNRDGLSTRSRLVP